MVTKLDLMGSSSCDLKCSYCYISKNCSFYNYDEVIKKAWEDGSYLKNTKEVFKKLNSDPLLVDDLQLWGGEPTLHMPIIAKQGYELGQTFPNICHFLIPTNWYQINVEALADFIYNLDKGINKRERSEDKLNFHIQASIDGPPGDFNTHGHHVDWDVYKKNFDDFCDIISKKGKIENTNIVIAICGTTTQHLLLKNLNTYDKIFEFKNYLSNVIDYILDKIKTVENVEIILSSRLWTPRIAISQQTTTEEAVELEKIVRMLEYYDFVEKVPTFEDANEIQFFHDVKGEFSYLERNHECPESNEEAITLMPDGTIAECPCTFLQNLDDYLQELLDNKDFWEYKSSLIRLPSFYNPLKNDIKNDEYHNWYVYNGGFLGTNSVYANLNLSMAYEMALSKQIDYIYALDPDLLIKHYLANFMTAECYREHVNVTHNHFLTDHNMFRRWFNGYTEYAYNDHKGKMEHFLKEILEEKINNE